MKSSLQDAQLIRVLKALADPRRFRMIRELAAAGELSCGRLGARFELSQPTVSHHLKILTDAGLLSARAEATRHFVSVNRALVEQVAALLPARLSAPSPRKAPRPGPGRKGR